MRGVEADLVDVLIYYDGPQLVVARQRGNLRPYLLMAVPCADDEWKMLGAEVSEEVLSSFLAGERDLRSIYVLDHLGALWITDLTTMDGEALTLHTFEGHLFDEWLPDPGLMMPPS